MTLWRLIAQTKEGRDQHRCTRVLKRATVSQDHIKGLRVSEREIKRASERERERIKNSLIPASFHLALHQELQKGLACVNPPPHLTHVIVR